jgi:hypothetical protein
MGSLRGWAAVVLVLAVGACSTPAKKETAASSPARASAGFGDASTATPPAAGAAVTTAAVPASGESTPTGAAPKQVAEANFLTPSGNIGCYVDKKFARCDIGKKSWSAPPKPADCAFDWGLGAMVEEPGAATLTCASDSLLGSTKTTLNYGQAVQAGDFVCRSDRSAVRCENTRSKHGFTLAVERYTLF